jgi:NAD+ kinase
MRVKVVTSGSQRSSGIANTLIEKLKQRNFIVDTNEADVIFIVGGDGTLIRNIKYGIPVIGIKAGRKAYLMDVDIKNIDEVLDRLISGDFRREEYPLLEYNFDNKRGIAFNEIGIIFDKPQTILGSVEIDKVKISFEGDGVLVSTPQGNWAWSFYITGTYIDFDTNVIQVTLLNPIKSNLKSLIINDNKEIKVSLEDKGRPQIAKIISDGEIIENILINSNKDIFIRKSNKKGVIYRFYNIEPLRDVICKE